MTELKTLKVILSKDFPLLADRVSSIIYFMYDKLELWIGQNKYTDPYVVVETFPTNATHGYLYLCLDDGTVKALIDYSPKVLAEIENEEQLELLKQTGSNFFIHSEKRYLDLQRRIVTLPYQNGTYELTVSLANDLIIDKDTVIAYNMETNQFDIFAHTYDAGLAHGEGYRGLETNTAKTVVSDNRISTEIKISRGYGNMLKFVSDGLYAYAEDRVTKKEFDSWKRNYESYKMSMEYYLKDLESQFENSQTVVSPNAISQRISDALHEVYPEIDTILASYDEIAAKFEGIEDRLNTRSDASFEAARTELREVITASFQNPWEDFGGEPVLPDPVVFSNPVYYATGDSTFVNIIQITLDMANYDVGVAKLVVAQDDNNVYSVDEDNLTLTVVPKNPIEVNMETMIASLTIPAGIIQNTTVYNEEAIINFEVEPIPDPEPEYDPVTFSNPVCKMDVTSSSIIVKEITLNMDNFEKGISTLVVEEDDDNIYSINEDDLTILVTTKNGISVDMSTLICYLTIPAGIIETEDVYNEEAIIPLDFNNNSGDETPEDDTNIETTDPETGGTESGEETTTPEEGTGTETTEPENGTTTEEEIPVEDETTGSEEVEPTLDESVEEETTTPEEDSTETT